MSGVGGLPSGLEWLADPTTVLGKLQRGTGDGFLEAVALPTDKGADLVWDCVVRDARWDQQVESRDRYYADLIEMAAALFESLLMNHPFVDGNKRVAFFAVDIFLRINGFHIAVDANNAHRKIIKIIEEGTRVKDSLENFLRKHTVKS